VTCVPNMMQHHLSWRLPLADLLLWRFRLMKLHCWLPLSRVQSSQCPEVPAEIVDTFPVIRAQVIPSHVLLHQGTLHSKSLSPHGHSVYTLDADQSWE
jgi:hypothetical protein